MGSEPFLSALFTTIQQLQSTSDAGSVDVAYLGSTLRKEGHDWATQGFGRLSVALAELQQEKRVETFRNEKGVLRVRAISAFTTQAVPKPKATPALLATQGRRFRPLRPPVWFAFAAALPDGQRRLVNCRSGMVWSDTNTPPGPSIDWVPVVPVGEDEQRRWADEFLDRADIGEDKETLAKSLQVADWFRQFPAELEKRGRVLVRAWSHLRSARIIEHVLSWAHKNNVADDVLFVAEQLSWSGQLTTAEPSSELTDLRQALLGAVAKMATEDLLTLPIPPRLVIEVVRPDLIR